MRFKFLVYLFSIIIMSSANATGRLKVDLADPDALVVGEDVYFTGTTVSEKEKILFYVTKKKNFVDVANGGGHQIDDSPVITYDPRIASSSNDRFCFVGAPDLHFDGSKVSLTFQAIRTRNTSATCDQLPNQNNFEIFYAEYIGDPNAFAFGAPHLMSSSVGGVSVVGTHAAPNQDNFKNIVPRIDSERFTDGSVTYWSYTWFTGAMDGAPYGNANSTVKMNNFNDIIIPIIDNTIANNQFDKGVTEAPNIFKRGETYYLVYSEHLFFDYYQVYYKKAASIAGLNREKTACRLTFNSWEMGANGINSGHGSVIEIGGDHYFIYHIGHGLHTFGGISRDTYVSKLKFDNSTDDIIQIPTPASLNFGPHVGNLPGCKS